MIDLFFYVDLVLNFFVAYEVGDGMGKGAIHASGYQSNCEPMICMTPAVVLSVRNYVHHLETQGNCGRGNWWQVLALCSVCHLVLHAARLEATFHPYPYPYPISHIPYPISISISPTYLLLCSSGPCHR